MEAEPRSPRCAGVYAEGLSRCLWARRKPLFFCACGPTAWRSGGQDSDFAISGQVEMDGIQTLRHPFKVLLDWLLVSPQVQFLLVAMPFYRRSKTVSHSLDLVHSALPFCRKVPISSRFRRVCSLSLILDAIGGQIRVEDGQPGGVLMVVQAECVSVS